MGALGGFTAYVVGRSRRRQQEAFADQVDSRVRVAQEVMEETVERLHAENTRMREDHQRELDECRAQFVEMAEALRECDRDRIRLLIRMGEIET